MKTVAETIKKIDEALLAGHYVLMELNNPRYTLSTDIEKVGFDGNAVWVYRYYGDDEPMFTLFTDSTFYGEEVEFEDGTEVYLVSDSLDPLLVDFLISDSKNI